MELQVVDNQDRSRFEILADGEVAGFVDYHLRDGEIALLHAETDRRFRDHGVAGHLVKYSLDSARERHLAVLPYCPFVRRWIADHPEYADLVPEDRRPHFGLLRIQRLSARPPLRTEVLDDPARLRVADLNQFLPEAAALPLGDHRAQRPAEIPPHALVRWAIIVLEAPDQPVGVVDRSIIGNKRVVRYRAGHLQPFSLSTCS